MAKRKIAWTVNIHVSGGPTFDLPQDTEVDAYDHIRIAIEGGSAGSAVTKKVEIQPGTASQVRLLVIKANKYDSQLSYEVNTADSGKRILDAPQIFAGNAVSLLDAAPTSLLFKNETSEEFEVEVLVGRDAITA